MKVVLADAVETDLEAIADFIAEDDPVRAMTFVSELDAKARDLGTLPMRFPVVPELAHIDVRKRLHHGYLIFYRIFVDHVLVLRILHGSREYLPLLDPGN